MNGRSSWVGPTGEAGPERGRLAGGVGEEAVVLGGEECWPWSGSRFNFSTSTSDSCMALSKAHSCLMEPPSFLSSYLPCGKSTTRYVS